MIYSNLIMFFIILTTAVTLNAHGRTHIATAQDAANALRPLAGSFAYLLFTAGMVGTGLLAVPALAGSSAYVAAETFRFRGSLDDKPDKAPRFYAVIVAVPLVGMVVYIANKESLMGKWRSSRLANLWGGFTFAAMSAAAVMMFVFWNR